MALRSRRIAVGTATAVLIIAMSFIAPPQEAAAAPVLDQQQTGIQPIDGGNTIGGPSHVMLAQVIQAGVTGALVSADLPVECLSALATLTIEVRSVLLANGRYSPTFTVLSSISLGGGSLPAKDVSGFRNFAFTPTVSFTAGARFAIVLSATGPGALDSCFIRHAPAGDTYAPGDGWFVADGQISPFTPGGWNCMCDSGSSAVASDHPFRTYVEPPAPPTGADLSITKTLVNPSNLNVFSATEQTYQLTVSNAGPAAATGVTIVDTLPSNITVVQAPPCVSNAGVLTCIPPASIPAGASFSMFIKVKFNNAGSYTNTASVSANETDPNTANNSSSHTQQVLPTADLLLLPMTASPGMAAPGDMITYTATVENLGPDPASDVTLVYTIPTTTTFGSVSGSPICGPGSNANEFGCRFSAGIPVGDKRSVTVIVTAPTTPQMLTSSATASHNMPPLIFDPNPPDGAPSSFIGFTSWVVQESVTQSVSAGGTATTDTEGDGAAPADPVETTVKSPSTGTITVTEQSSSPASGDWAFLGAEVVISAPAGTAADPLILAFRLDKTVVESLVAPSAPVQIFRNNSTTPVPDCPMTTATPPQPVLPLTVDPCVASRTTLSDGDLEIVVYTSQASVWTFATREPFRFGGFEPPMGSTRHAGSTLPLKFKLLDASTGEIVSDAQLQVLIGGSPFSRSVSCRTSVALEDWTPVSIVGGGLHFDADTNAYSVNWKTEKAWAGTCRELLLQLLDGSEHTTTVVFD